MAYYNKVGMLIFNADHSAFLVGETKKKFNKGERPVQYLMPGGQFEPGESATQCLAREIQEELMCEVDPDSLQFIAEYLDVSAASPDRDVSIKLYQGQLIGEPFACSEIAALHWISQKEYQSELLSPIIRNKIIPDLLRRKILMS
ncbi:NUDIX domain-containing protein [Candidatus Uhrbacteria bacterium]|nr:NUDIX domain-containing protein [Candidatus Uhrbacteria bacterium]